jgi:hypothetical protein
VIKSIDALTCQKLFTSKETFFKAFSRRLQNISHKNVSLYHKNLLS